MSDSPIYDKNVAGNDSPIYNQIEKPVPKLGPITDPVPSQGGDHGVNAPSSRPQKKVVAATAGAGIGAAVSVVLVWAIEASANIDIPESVELAIPIIIGTALTFVAGYFKRN